MPLELEAIATVNPDLHGKKLKDTPFRGSPELDDVLFIGIVDAIENTDAPVVFSGLDAKLTGRYGTRLGAGRLLVPLSVAGRQERADAPIVSIFVNNAHIDELYKRDLDGRVINSGHSIASIVSVPLAPLHREIGIERLDITTLQGWSDIGVGRVPDLASETGDGAYAHAIDKSKNGIVQAHINRVLGGSMDTAADIAAGHMKLQHGPWLRGFHARVAVRLAKDVGEKDIEELWRHFEAPPAVERLRGGLRAVSQTGGEKWPKRHERITPVKLEYDKLLRSDANSVRHMRPLRVTAHILEFSPDDPRTLVFEMTGDNVIGGSIGNGLLNVLYARAAGYI